MSFLEAKMPSRDVLKKNSRNDFEQNANKLEINQHLSNAFWFRHVIEILPILVTMYIQ